MPRQSRASRCIADWLKTGTPEEPHTQEDLAKRISTLVDRNVSQSTISQIKSGSQSPRGDLIAAFKIVLGIEAEWWLPDAASGHELSAGDTKTPTGTEG